MVGVGRHERYPWTVAVGVEDWGSRTEQYGACQGGVRARRAGNEAAWAGHERAGELSFSGEGQRIGRAAAE